jgi:hypothetical protein
MMLDETDRVQIELATNIAEPRTSGVTRQIAERASSKRAMKERIIGKSPWVRVRFVCNRC